MAKQAKPADASTAQVASTERSFPHPFGSQEIQRARHASNLLIDYTIRTAKTLAEAVDGLQTIKLILNGSGKQALMGLMEAQETTGMPLVKIETLTAKLYGFKEGWPKNSDAVRAFLASNEAAIKSLEGKTKFEVFKDSK
tara:strand:- start:80 stop:499 length:420 start_codon:yes stop_codon:yes gene_type:complete